MEWKKREKELLDQIDELEEELCKCKSIIEGMHDQVSAMAQINDNQWNTILGMKKELEVLRK